MATLANIYDFRKAEAARRARSFVVGSRICLINFADGETFEEGQRLQNKSAVESGEFDIIEMWSKRRLQQTDFYKKNKEILDHSRGAGYWLWKPFIIYDAMSRLQDGDFIIYCDAGLTATRSFQYSVFPLCFWLAQRPRRLGMTRLVNYKNSSWTKKDCFFYMDCDSELYWNHDHIQASYIALQVNAETRSLIWQWLSECEDIRIISDNANTCGVDNEINFTEHRHDQSVLTNLIIKHKFELPWNNKYLSLNKNINNLLRRSIYLAATAPNGYPLRNYEVNQSSISFWSHNQTESYLALNIDHPYDYAFHTNRDINPWWLAKFPSCKLSEIQIRNRIDCEKARARKLCVEIEIADNCWIEIFNASFSRWNLFDPIILDMRGLEVSGIKVYLQAEEYFHLHSVAIFACEPHRGSESDALHYFQNTTALLEVDLENALSLPLCKENEYA